MGTLAEDVKYLKEPVIYFSKYKNHTHTIRSTSTIIIDGKTVKRPPLHLVFKDNKATTKDPRVVEIMDNDILTQKKWSSIMYKAPTREEQERAKKVSAKLADARKKILAEMGDDIAKPEVGARPKSFKDFLSKEEKALEKSEQKLVQGRRSVGDLSGRTTQ